MSWLNQKKAMIAWLALQALAPIHAWSQAPEVCADCAKRSDPDSVIPGQVKEIAPVVEHIRKEKLPDLHVSLDQRRQLLERSKIWTDIDTSQLDILKGPDEPRAPKISESPANVAQIRCVFDGEHKKSGASKKFYCKEADESGTKLPNARTLKIKYHHNSPELRARYGDNKEVFAEIISTRLGWALGLKMDRIYPAVTLCYDCPEDPDTRQGRHGTRPFALSSTEVKVPGAEITGVDIAGKAAIEGWSFNELMAVDSSKGGATRAEIDAFLLFAAFIQHGDNKAVNQRMICPPEFYHPDKSGAERCEQPFLMIQDPGASFGASSSFSSTDKANLDDWKSKRIWKELKDGRRCVADLKGHVTGTLDFPEISEAGRQFFLARVKALSDSQIADLFRVARIESAEPHYKVEDWVKAFKEKVAQVEHPDPRNPGFRCR